MVHRRTERVFVVAAISDLVSGSSGEEGPGVLAGMVVFFTIVGVLGYRLATAKTPKAPRNRPSSAFWPWPSRCRAGSPWPRWCCTAS